MASDEDENQQDERPVTYVYLLALIACMNSTNLGYDIGGYHILLSYTQFYNF
jgi:hypothetical protein